MDVAADRPAKAEKRLIEALPVVQALAADHASDLEMTPGLVDPSARVPVRHRRLQWAEKRHVPEAGNIVLYDCPCRKYIGRTGRGVRDLVDVDIGLPEGGRDIGHRVLEPGRKHRAIGTLIGVSDLRHARPAGGCRHAALVGQLGVGVGVVHDTGLLTYQECTQRPVGFAQPVEPAGGDTGGAAVDRVGVVDRPVPLDIGLGLAPGGRGAGINYHARSARRDVERRAARMRNRVVERDAVEIARAAWPIEEGVVDLPALVIQLTAVRRPIHVPLDSGPHLAADAQ